MTMKTREKKRFEKKERTERARMKTNEEQVAGMTQMASHGITKQ